MTPTPAPASAERPPGPYELFASPIHGKGLRTTTAIPAGTVIFVEEPMLQLAKSFIKPNDLPIKEVMRQTLGEATPEERRLFLGLHNCFSGPVPEVEQGEEAPLVYDFMTGTFATNALDISPTVSAVFCVASRLNHSCTPNATYTYSANRKRLSLRNLVPLAPNTELTISYLDPVLPFEVRQSKLFHSHRFRCGCEACGNPSLAPGEFRRRRIALLRQVLALWKKRAVRAGDVMRIAHEVLDAEGVLEQEGLLGMRGELWKQVSVVAAAHSSIAQTRVAAQAALDAFLISEGNKGPSFVELRDVVKDPRKHSAWGTREYVDFEAAPLKAEEIEALVPGWGEETPATTVGAGAGGGKKKKQKKKKKKKAAAKVDGEAEQNEASEDEEGTPAPDAATEL